MAGHEYLDKQGVSALWERIQQLVYECGCRCAVKYRLESDGNVITLVGSDGSRSVVTVESVAQCNNE